MLGWSGESDVQLPVCRVVSLWPTHPPILFWVFKVTKNVHSSIIHNFIRSYFNTFMQDESDPSYILVQIKWRCWRLVLEDGGWPGTWEEVHGHYGDGSDVRRFRFHVSSGGVGV